MRLKKLGMLFIYTIQGVFRSGTIEDLDKLYYYIIIRKNGTIFADTLTFGDNLNECINKRDHSWWLVNPEAKVIKLRLVGDKK